MDRIFPVTRLHARKTALRSKEALTAAWQRVGGSLRHKFETTTTVAGEAYNSALDWKDNSELSHWLTDHLSHQVSTLGSRAMDYEYLHTHIGGSWHRLYDGGHSLSGSWKAVSGSLPDLTALDRIGDWANEYWKDLITTRGMCHYPAHHDRSRRLSHTSQLRDRNQPRTRLRLGQKQ